MARRTCIVALLGVFWSLAWTQPAYAHGIAGSLELPLPLSYFVTAAGLALVLTFSLLVGRWPRPRWQEPSEGRPLSSWGRWVVVALIATGVIGLALVIGAGLFGEDRRTNAAPALVWVYLWLVLPFAAVFLGDLWRYINPWRTFSGDRTRLSVPGAATGVGIYPAAAAFFVFMWLGLVPDYGREAGVAAMAAIAYSLYLGAAIYLTDRQRAFGSFEAFTPYNYLVGAVGPLELDPNGTWRWHGWLKRLAAIQAPPGLAVFVSVVIGSIVYDGLSSSDVWVDAWGTTRFEEWFGTTALAATIVVVWGVYRFAIWTASRLAGGKASGELAESFAHVLVPVAISFAVTHYLTVIAFEGQLMISIVSDPFGRGSDFFGTALREVQLWIGSTAVWYVQLAVIIGGHVAAAVLAHDRALHLFTDGRAVRSQYVLLPLLILSSSIGLLLLSAA